MKICPGCYSSIPGKGAKICPYCGLEEPSKQMITRKKTLPTILAYTAVCFGIVMFFVLFDQVLSGGISLTSDCGGNEQCLITGFATCDTVRASPNTYGISTIDVRGELGGRCLVDVEMTTNEGIYDAVETKKTCAFRMDDLGGKQYKDFFLCVDFEEQGQQDDFNAISNAFVPPADTFGSLPE